MSTEETEQLRKELTWWKAWLTELPKKFKDNPGKLKDHIEYAKQQVQRLKQLIVDRKAGRGDRVKKENETRRWTKQDKHKKN